jgi:hypothetical protein
MKWIALLLIALGALLFADHRNGIFPVASGVFLLGYWYFVEREPAEQSPEETRDDPQADTDAVLVESSTSFNQAGFLPYLQQIQCHFSGGFGGRVVDHIAGLALRMKHNEERSMEYLVTFRDRSCPLKIGLFRDDLEEITVYFHCPKPLADLIDSEMESFILVRGM